VERLKTIGALTIGQAPRADDLVAEMCLVLGDGYRLVERGALDGLSHAQVQALAPAGDDDLLITLMADGTPVRLGKRRILPLLQARIDELEGEGVDATLLLCTGAFPAFAARRPVLRPQPALYGLVAGLAGDQRLGVLTPLPDQIPQTRRTWLAAGVDPVLAAASPYAERDEVAAAARQLAAAGVDLVFMDCFGYSLAMRRLAAAVLQRPVVLARSAVARIVAELAD
jgi:protein AroM